MKSYHFDCGNSSAGPVGMCARVNAESEAEAVEILNKTLEEFGDGVEVGMGYDDLNGIEDQKGVEYLTFYPGKVTAEHIDSIDPIED